MNINDIRPDPVILRQWGGGSLNSTLLFTWGIMIPLVTGSVLVTRHPSSGIRISRWQNLLEIIVAGIREHIRDISHQDPGRYIPLAGTLFVFAGVSNLLAIVPGYIPPAASLSTTTALAICVYIGVNGLNTKIIVFSGSDPRLEALLSRVWPAPTISAIFLKGGSHVPNHTRSGGRIEAGRSNLQLCGKTGQHE